MGSWISSTFGEGGSGIGSSLFVRERKIQSISKSMTAPPSHEIQIDFVHTDNFRNKNYIFSNFSSKEGVAVYFIINLFFSLLSSRE